MNFRAHKLGLWSLSLMTVLGIHAAIFCWALYWKPKTPPQLPPPAAMLIQLEPLPAPAPVPEPPKPVVLPEPEPEPAPEVVVAPKPKLVIAQPKPKPKPRPKPPEPKPEPPKPAEPTPPAEPAASPPQPSADKPPAAPQRADISDTSAAEANWKGKLMARLARYKEYPDDARRRRLEGEVKILFVVDGSGRVLSQEVVTSSRHRSLDRAALRQIRRAQPLPKPPPELLINGTREVTLPLKFELPR